MTDPLDDPIFGQVLHPSTEARAIRIPKPRRPKIPAEIRVPIKMPAVKEIAKI